MRDILHRTPQFCQIIISDKGRHGYSIGYLLLEFPPLAKHFDARHRHPLVLGEAVMRARLQDDRMGLLIREAFGKQLLEEAIEVVREAEE